VTLFEMAGHAGGRARSIDADGDAFDNGQHILIGAYSRTLALMQAVGVDIEACLHRMPLELRYPDGRGLRMPAGPAWLGFGRAVLGSSGWSVGDRLALLAACARWAAAGFACAPSLTVADLCRTLPAPVRQLLIDPLCVAALNTQAGEASATVFLRVLRDALFGGRGAADLLLPRRGLDQLLPVPAIDWLRSRGAEIRLATRSGQLKSEGACWRLDGEAFDRVVLACGAHEAARLTAPVSADWAAGARALQYEPILTVYLRAPGASLPAPMMALVEGPLAPAQFAFDHGALGARPGRFAFVISGARRWAEQGLEATGKAVLEQAVTGFPQKTWPHLPSIERVLAEKRATFKCVPGLRRPQTRIAPGLAAAGDYIEGPYPATLEGAVRAGEAAAAAVLR
jgi:squalene-associated FAD-dependent desaturase